MRIVITIKHNRSSRKVSYGTYIFITFLPIKTIDEMKRLVTRAKYTIQIY